MLKKSVSHIVAAVWLSISLALMLQGPCHAISSANAMGHASCLIRLLNEERGKAVDITPEQTQLLMD